MKGRLIWAGLLAALVALAAATSATAGGGPVQIERVTWGLGDTNPDTSIVLGSLSIDDEGGLVAFESVASNLVTGDTPGSFDVFMRDIGSSTTTLENLTSGGVRADSVFSGDPALWGNGDGIVFYSTAQNLAAELSEDQDVFKRTFAGGTTTRQSFDAADGEPDGEATNPDVTDFGNSTVYESTSSDVVAFDNNGTPDVFRRDLAAMSNSLVSLVHNEGAIEGDAASYDPSISGSGVAVVFTSDATNLTAGESDGAASDVYVRDGTTTERLSVTDAEQESSSPSFSPDTDEDSSRTVFVSSGVLAPGGHPDGRGVYVRDRGPDTTERIDVPWGPDQDDNNEVQPDEPTISDDGRYVAFASDASTLVPNDTNGTTDVFVRDTLDARTIRVSVRSDGTQTTRRSLTGTISGDGGEVAFASEDNGLVDGDTTDPGINELWEGFWVQPEWDRPDTGITGPAPLETTVTQVTTSFESSKAGSTFQCRLDGGQFTQCASPYTTPTLPLGAHTVEIRAVDAFGNTDDSPAATSFVIQAPQQPQETQVPPPDYRDTVNVEPVSGEVFVQLPDGRRVPIETLTSIPDGSIIDARSGKVRLIVETRDGRVETSVWSQGVFRVVQLANGITECRLVGPLSAAPGSARAGAAAAAPRAHAAKKRRRLWGNGKGKFRTKGNFASGTVRGTKWLTEDRPGLTLILVRRGVVAVRDRVQKKTVLVRKGERYIARKLKRRSRR